MLMQALSSPPGLVDDPDVALPSGLLHAGGRRLLDCLRLRIQGVDLPGAPDPYQRRQARG